MGLNNAAYFSITNCYSKLSITSASANVGGFVGNGWAYADKGIYTSCFFSGEIIGREDGSFRGTFNGNKSLTHNSCYYDNTKSLTVKNFEGTGLNNFGSMTSLPDGLSSDEWTIVKGYPELKVFIK